ncbi:MAG: hypothetical protein CMJ20_13380 [Phycisphaeraceae bacterium]|nr:hypothetical protein [Phycisphaeraceae bacterium]|tara:strand:+ start:2500 stop:3501 length:1002 start_codon:yes stop_codon:yes gene_type:complete
MEQKSRSISWYRVPVDKQTLKRLHQRSNWKGALQISGHLGLIGLLGTVAWQFQANLMVLLPMLFLYGTCFAFIMNATHELHHQSVFQTKFLNGFFLRLLSFFGWRSYVLFSSSHGAHHKYTLHQPDDLEVVLPAKLTLMTFLRTAFVDVLGIRDSIWRTLALSMGKVDTQWNEYLLDMMATDKRRDLIHWARFILLGHVSIVAVSFYFGLWMIPVLTTFAIFYGQWLRFLCNQTQHAGLADAVKDFRLCTRTIILSPPVGFLYWHMNYHIEHHMYPAVPCYNLRKLHAAIRHELPKSPRGLLTAWRQIIATVKRQAVEPDYHFVPTLPTTTNG